MIENNGPAGHGASEEPAAPPIDDNFKGRAGTAVSRRPVSQDAGADLWDFALENDRLYATGLTISDLRGLVAKGFAEHGQETSFYGDHHRHSAPVAASTSSPHPFRPH